MIPISLVIKNFLSHKSTSIDFTLFNSALLIGNTDGDYSTSNGCGKSALFEAITWALFNKSRVAKMDEVILFGEERCEVQFTFKQKDAEYLIKRSRTKITGTSPVEFYKKDGLNLIDISGSTASLTNEKITKILKLDYKTFVNSAYFRQNDISEFSQSDASRKKEILKSIIDLSKWDAYEKDAKNKLKHLKSEIEILESKIASSQSDESYFLASKNRLASLLEAISVLEQSKITAESSVDSLKEKYHLIKSSLDTDSWDKISSKNEKIKKEASELKSRLNDISSYISTSQSEIDSYNKSLFRIEEDLSFKKDSYPKETELQSLNDELLNYRTLFETSKSVLASIQKKEVPKDSCGTCRQTISPEHYESICLDIKTQVDELELKIKSSKLKIADIDSRIRNTKSLIAEAALISEKEKQALDLKIRIDTISNKISNLEKQKASIKAQLEAFKQEFQQNVDLLKALKNEDFTTIADALAAEKEKKLEIEKKLASSYQEIGLLKEKVKNIEEVLEKNESVKEELDKKKESLVVYEYLSKYFGKNGIQTILLNALINDLESSANNTLKTICNESFQIFLETQRLHSDGVSYVETLDLIVKKDSLIQSFESLSGGEQFRISLALRIALSEISSKYGGSSLEFLLLDEVNSPLDKHGTETLFVNVIKSLESRYKILVITHDEMLKEKFENIIDVTKTNGESSAIFYTK